MSRPFQVFVNGVPKQEGSDFVVRGTELVFADVLVQPRKMTLRSYVRAMFFGRYATEHTVDVVHDLNGQRVVANELDILPPT